MLEIIRGITGYSTPVPGGYVLVDGVWQPASIGADGSFGILILLCVVVMGAMMIALRQRER